MRTFKERGIKWGNLSIWPNLTEQLVSRCSIKHFFWGGRGARRDPKNLKFYIVFKWKLDNFYTIFPRYVFESLIYWVGKNRKHIFVPGTKNLIFNVLYVHNVFKN